MQEILEVYPVDLQKARVKFSVAEAVPVATLFQRGLHAHAGGFFVFLFCFFVLFFFFVFFLFLFVLV